MPVRARVVGKDTPTSQQRSLGERDEEVRRGFLFPLVSGTKKYSAASRCCPVQAGFPGSGSGSSAALRAPAQAFLSVL